VTGSAAGRILVTGATGNVGGPLLRELAGASVSVRAGVRRPERVRAPGVQAVRFDVTDPGTYAAALADVRSVFLVRPPQVGDPGVLVEFLRQAQSAGTRHVVFLSIQGAGRLQFLPHARIEKWLQGSGLAWTSLRASFFDQNLIEVHGPAIRTRSELVMPAGRGRTAFVDAVDVAAVAARVLLEPESHYDRAWTLTGSEALTYGEVAGILTAVLGRQIRYTQPGLAAYLVTAHRRLGLSPPLVAATGMVYTTARLGLAAGLSPDLPTILGRPATTMTEFVRREQAAFQPMEL
jgi:uncharacterized protein YbjT (DUF2867 family)